MSEKVELFVVNLTIIEGRHFAWPNMDSAVHVRVDNQKKCTAIRYSTDCPFFNEFFVFEFSTTLETLMDKTITLTVIQPRKAWRSKKTLGYVTLDMATVWSQPDHQFYHKWAVIAATINDPAGGSVGYVKVDINILRKGESPQIPTTDPQDTDEIEGNLLLPEGMTTERQRASYICKIYRGENLCKGKYWDSQTAAPSEKDPPSCYVEMSFAGLKATTSTKKHLNPEWNESLILTELFPPLCQRIKINLCYTGSCSDATSAVRHINLRSISNDGEHGFLPTFGPTFLHFYARGDTSEGYVGKILMSFSTDLQLNTVGIAKSVRVEPMTTQLSNNMWKNELVLLYGTIFDANLIDKKYAGKLVSYELSFGNSELQSNATGDGGRQACNITPPLEPLTKGKLYLSLIYGQDKPSVNTLGFWPDFRQRLYNSNMISKIADELKFRLNKIEDLFTKEQFNTPEKIMDTLLLEAIDSLSSACRKYIDISQGKTGNAGTELDRERKKLCLREMGDIENATKEIYNPKMKKKCFKILLDTYERLQLLIDDCQDCWPDVYVTMVAGTKRVAFCKCPIADLVYSVVDEERGKHCGKIQNLFLQSNHKKPELAIACKLSIFLWVGLERYRKECFKALPDGFKSSTDISQKNLPHYLVAQEKHCRVHIYQGKFLPGSDKSGLCDPFARVIIASDCYETTVTKATLNPVWDQTLIFRQLIVYGAKLHIKSDPPLIVMEVFDQDKCCKTEFVGRSTFKPVVKFSNESYAAPDFPPKLSWHKIYNCGEVVGEVLAVAEFLETSENTDGNDLTPSNEIVKIPSDIKPTMVAYRIEVIFWGVRELQKILLLPVTKPKVVIECAYVVMHSDTILSTNKNLNFSQANKQMDISLPDQEEYAPPICIKLFDCRSFGRHILVGTHIVSLGRFMYYPLTKEQRIHKFLEVERKSLRSTKSKHGIVSVPMITIETEIQPKNNTPISKKPRYKQWLNRIFGTNENDRLSYKKQSEKKSQTDEETSDDNLEARRPLLGLKQEKKETGDSVSSGDAFHRESFQKRSKTLTKKKGNKTKPSRSESSSTGKSTKSSSTTSLSRNKKKKKAASSSSKDSESKRGNKNKKRTNQSTTSSSSTLTALKKRNKTEKRTNQSTTSSEDSRSNLKKQEKNAKAKVVTIGGTFSREDNQSRLKTKSSKMTKKRRKMKKNKSTDSDITDESIEQKSYCKKMLKKLFRRKSQPKVSQKNSKNKAAEKVETEPKDYDWWTKYYDSAGASIKQVTDKSFQNRRSKLKSKQTSTVARKPPTILQIYPNELEAQPEFEGFYDTLQSFQVYKGKRTGDEIVDEANITGIFKGFIKLYRWVPSNNQNYVTETGLPLSNGAFQNFPSNEPLKFLVRIYCIKGINLRPKDATGKSDPYIVVNMGGKVINDKDNYVPKQVNPIFGRCFELNGGFPHDHAVTISVWDWDLTTSHDLIGETKIDLENRFFTRHRAHCGIANEYQKTGYCSWRDQEAPSRILENLCKKSNIDVPKYTERCVQILLQEFYPECLNRECRQTSFDKETLALCALRHWQEVPVVGCCLVPEHVETRSLYHAAKPGIEQGKLQLWIDIFPSTDLPPPPKVNITPRKPVAYELRVIIWNTDDVILEEDDFFVGEKMSDIYVKGWLTGPEESQCTDVHYRSMTGEGSFNWRFIFRFKYYPTENKLVKTKKESLFSIDETEFKLPCRLSLQVWDNDTISADDFLGIVTLELAHLPRGARSAETCTLSNLAPNAPTINLFKTRRTKGWWPFRGRDKETNVEILAGKVEAELELVTVEEAEKNPVGLARAEPQQLPKPTRPDTSFSWFRNPMKALKFLICKHYRWKIIKSIILILLLFGIGLAVYSFPGYSVKKLLHV